MISSFFYGVVLYNPDYVGIDRKNWDTSYCEVISIGHGRSSNNKVRIYTEYTNYISTTVGLINHEYLSVGDGFLVEYDKTDINKCVILCDRPILIQSNCKDSLLAKVEDISKPLSFTYRNKYFKVLYSFVYYSIKYEKMQLVNKENFTKLNIKVGDSLTVCFNCNMPFNSVLKLPICP